MNTDLTQGCCPWNREFQNPNHRRPALTDRSRPFHLAGKKNTNDLARLTFGYHERWA
jgi:hypothetical protein